MCCEVCFLLLRFIHIHIASYLYFFILHMYLFFFNIFHPVVHRLTCNICLLPSNTTTLIKYPGYRMSLYYVCFRLHVSADQYHLQTIQL
jgi:hypothetical protein